MLTRAIELKQISPKIYEKLIGAETHMTCLTQYLTLTHGALSGEVSPRVLVAIAALSRYDRAAALEAETIKKLNDITGLAEKIIGI